MNSIRPPRDRERIASHEQRLIALERDLEHLRDEHQALEFVARDDRESSTDAQLDIAGELASVRERVGRLEGLAEQLQNRAGQSAARGAAGGVVGTIALVLAALLARALGLELPN